MHIINVQFNHVEKLDIIMVWYDILVDMHRIYNIAQAQQVSTYIHIYIYIYIYIQILRNKKIYVK